MNGWKSEAPGANAKSPGNGRGIILGLKPGRLPPGENQGKFAGQTHFPSVKYTYRHCPVSMPVCETFKAAVVADVKSMEGLSSAWGVAPQLSNPSDRSSVKKTEIPISYSTENSEEQISQRTILITQYLLVFPSGNA
jgi:hypothetical protein